MNINRINYTVFGDEEKLCEADLRLMASFSIQGDITIDEEGERIVGSVEQHAHHFPRFNF